MSTPSPECTCESRYPPQSPRDSNYPKGLLARLLAEEDLFEEIKCPSWHSQSVFPARFFRCKRCSHAWIYAEPDGPWGGSWGRICICQNSSLNEPEQNADFPRFLKRLLAKSNLFEEIRREEVNQPNDYPLLGRVKRFFRCRKCGGKWQYSKPDPGLPPGDPREGGWEEVD